MLANLKTKFYSLIKGLNYNITDNGKYVENFPWLMLRTNSSSTASAVNSTTNNVILTLDIFSTYSGEKEIIEIAENIFSHLAELRNSDSNILYCNQKSLKILDDKSTGPVRKHGVVNYEFLLGCGYKEEVPENGAN